MAAAREDLEGTEDFRVDLVASSAAYRRVECRECLEDSVGDTAASALAAGDMAHLRRRMIRKCMN